MNPKIPLLLATIVTVSGSFLQSPKEFQSTFNSSFLKENNKLFKPIIIPNITKATEQPPTSKLYETDRTLGNETALKRTLKPKEISEGTTLGENYSDEEPKTAGISLKFSSRYSTKSEIREDLLEEEKTGENENSVESTTEIPNSETNGVSVTEKRRSFSDRSDDLDDVEEKDDTFEYDTNKPRQAEQSEIASTTNEPFGELQRPTSFRSTSYPDDDYENYETTAISAEENDSSDEEEEESKRSINDYDNSGSKNYHSIQTPLNQVKYRGAHTFGRDFGSERPRTRLLSPISRYHAKPKWPYSRTQIKPNLEQLNEISDSDETYEKDLEEQVKEEVKTKPKQLELESAVKRDEYKFDRNKKHNYVEERNRMKQQKKGLLAEEEKDDKVPLFQSLKQYQVDEEPRDVDSKFKANEDIWSSKSPVTTPGNLFAATSSRKPQQFGESNEIDPYFQGKHFLGPVVFNHYVEEEKPRLVKAKHHETQKVPISNTRLKGLLEKENLDQDNLSNQRIHKTIFATGTEPSPRFNHLEEIDEMYNSILANIQAVFGIRTQSYKSGTGGRKDSGPEENPEESKSLTWSEPLIKREKVN